MCKIHFQFVYVHVIDICQKHLSMIKISESFQARLARQPNATEFFLNVTSLTIPQKLTNENTNQVYKQILNYLIYLISILLIIYNVI